MADQANLLLKNKPRQNQLGRPPICVGTTPGSTACTDNCGVEIVRLETGRLITPAQFRARTPRANVVCKGLRPSDLLAGLRAFGVRGYAYHSRVTVDDVLRATDESVVLVGVGYRQYPRLAGMSGPGGVAEVGGKTDVHFQGSHAITVWGRRTWTKKPADWPRLRVFTPGTRVWGRDPDHHQGFAYQYDRYSKAQLAEAMRALVTETPWTTTFAIWKG